MAPAPPSRRPVRRARIPSRRPASRNPTVSSTIALGVTDLAGVFTYRNDASRDAVNAQEYALTRRQRWHRRQRRPASFGKLFSCVADGAVYAQPLWAANLTINGAQHNVVFVASAHDSLFAFDADANPCVQLWSVSLIDSGSWRDRRRRGHRAGRHDRLSGGQGYGDITPEVGVIGTPVIDPSSGTLYVVSKSMDPAGTDFLPAFACDRRDDRQREIQLAPAHPGHLPRNRRRLDDDHIQRANENQRAGLALVNGTVYIAWASHEDTAPYYGWLMGYTYGAAGFTQVSVLNVTPNVQWRRHLDGRRCTLCGCERTPVRDHRQRRLRCAPARARPTTIMAIRYCSSR